MKPGFFTESNGNPSIMRVMCFISLFASIGFGGVGVIRNNQAARDLAYYFCTMAMTGKVAQKAVEK
jgi:hypothetical protein